VRSGPKEGVLVHGLFLDGAAWSRNESSLVESEPKKLFSPLPLVMVTALTKGLKRSMAGDYGPFGAYGEWRE
jgi:dynein heavy chain, axonemal